MFAYIALAAANGSYLSAEGGDGWEVCAIPPEIGSWETFRLFNRTRPGEEPRHGDSVVLQAWHGRFLSAVGGGGGALNAALRWIEASTTFTIERVAGAGTVRSGDEVALRAANGNYVVAEGGGGGAVNANRTYRTAWETFTIKIFRPQLVRLRALDGRYVTAEGGGGGQVTANRLDAGTWEAFSLHNLSRPERAVQARDIVALQVWNGKFIRVGGALPAAVTADMDRAAPAAQFSIRTSGVGEIGHGQRVQLRSRETSKFLAARFGRLTTRSSPSDINTFFTVEFAEQAGIDFEWIPDGLGLPDRPLATPSYPVSGNRKILVLHLNDGSNPPLSIINEQLTSALFGPAPSLAEWYRNMSNGIFTVSNAGVFGPIRVLSTSNLGHILTMAERQGVPLASFARDGVIRDSEVAIIRLGVGQGGQKGTFDVISAGGVRYQGVSAGIGVSPDMNEASRMVVAHEISHMFMEVNDRYGVRRPIRGDVIANATSAGTQSQFIVERAAGPGPLRSGDRVTIRAYNGKYLAVGSGPPDLVSNLINTEDATAGPARFFTIAKVAGVGEIASGTQVTFRSSSSRYMTAELGGNSSMTANRSSVGDWEPFEISKVGGTGILSSGDTVTLRSSGGYFVVAAEGARDIDGRPGRTPAVDAADRRRGYIWDVGIGEGGQFDNASDNGTAVMLSLFDRLRLGWARPRYLTPDNRGCFVISPFLTTRNAIILFDPQNPGEWYTVENRQRRENLDEVPSSGVVISWICEEESYWRWWYNRANDNAWDGYRTRYPVVLSAVALDVPPNSMARPVVFNVFELTRRNDPNAAFIDQEIVLPLGNGDPSRFHLSFHPVEGSENIAICIR
jgi:hypothetical protein